MSPAISDITKHTQISYALFFAQDSHGPDPGGQQLTGFTKIIMLFHQVADEAEKRNEPSQCRTDNVEVVDRQGRHGWPPNPERTLKIRRTAMSASSMALLNSRRSLTAKLNKYLLLLHEVVRDD